MPLVYIEGPLSFLTPTTHCYRSLTPFNHLEMSLNIPDGCTAVTLDGSAVITNKKAEWKFKHDTSAKFGDFDLDIGNRSILCRLTQSQFENLTRKEFSEASLKETILERSASGNTTLWDRIEVDNPLTRNCGPESSRKKRLSVCAEKTTALSTTEDIGEISWKVTRDSYDKFSLAGVISLSSGQCSKVHTPITYAEYESIKETNFSEECLRSIKTRGKQSMWDAVLGTHRRPHSSSLSAESGGTTTSSTRSVLFPQTGNVIAKVLS